MSEDFTNQVHAPGEIFVETTSLENDGQLGEISPQKFPIFLETADGDTGNTTEVRSIVIER